MYFLGNKDNPNFPEWATNILLIRVSPGDSTVADFSFTVGFFGVCAALLLVCIQYSLDCKEYALQKYTHNDSREAREIYFRSFIGTAIYGHLTIDPNRVPTALKYGMILFTEILYFGNLIYEKAELHDLITLSNSLQAGIAFFMF